MMKLGHDVFMHGAGSRCGFKMRSVSESGGGRALFREDRRTVSNHETYKDCCGWSTWNQEVSPAEPSAQYQNMYHHSVQCTREANVRLLNQQILR